MTSSHKDPHKHSSQQIHNTVTLVDDILNQATQAGASDVHFEPTGKGLDIRFRLDGLLTTVETLPSSVSENVIARLKVLGGLLTYRNDIPQEGRIELPSQTSARVFDQRLAVFPTIYGQRAVVRLFYEETGLAELDQLGFDERLLSAMQTIASSNQGILLLTGPAGSGKSTTLAALLRHIHRSFPGKSIVSLEDPVERRIDGVTQVQISSQGQMTFPVALRSLLRQDPEVLMIGEIRDAETAGIAIEAGLTGHLLMSTLHSGSPAGGLLRLLDMGIEPYQVTSSISAVVNQRLVRRLCMKCRKQTHDKHYHATGCIDCFHTGYKGRILIAEMLQLDGAIREALLAKADHDQLQTMLNNRGHRTLRQDGMRLIDEGMTTEEELLRTLGPAG